MTHQTNHNPPMLQPSTVQTATPPPRKIGVGKCSAGRGSLIGVLRPNSLYYFFEYKKGKLIPHACCSCQANTTEADLRPLYSEWSDKLGETVIFVYNRVSNKVEQYVCREEFGRLEQVEKSGLIYNSGFSSQSNIIASIDVGEKSILIERDSNGSMRKHLKFGERFTHLVPMEVKTMIVKEVEERGDEEDEEVEEDSELNDSIDSEEEDDHFAEVNNAYNTYRSKIPQFSITTCLHDNRDLINVFDFDSDTYKSFYYEERTGDFYPSVCPSCPRTIVEDHLYPKYIEIAKDNEYVIHVYNSFTRLMEKYVYAPTTECFEQVDYPELVYDPSKNMTASILFVETSTSTRMFMAIMRDSDGRIKKEQFSQVNKQFVKMPPATVKTFIVLKREEDEKKKEEERKKRREEKKAEKLKKNKVISDSSLKTSQSSVRESTSTALEEEERRKKEVEMIEREMLMKDQMYQALEAQRQRALQSRYANRSFIREKRQESTTHPLSSMPPHIPLETVQSDSKEVEETPKRTTDYYKQFLAKKQAEAKDEENRFKGEMEEYKLEEKQKEEEMMEVEKNKKEEMLKELNQKATIPRDGPTDASESPLNKTIQPADEISKSEMSVLEILRRRMKQVMGSDHEPSDSVPEFSDDEFESFTEEIDPWLPPSKRNRPNKKEEEKKKEEAEKRKAEIMEKRKKLQRLKELKMEDDRRRGKGILIHPQIQPNNLDEILREVGIFRNEPANDDQQ
uniref:Wsv104 n=1 Tax=Caenorhabditis tropicalis TaxID=1561998 RepID=A0A1I7UNU6_9PELO